MEFIQFCLIPALLVIGVALARVREIGKEDEVEDKHRNKRHLIRPHILNRLVDQKLCGYCNTVNVASAYACITCKREFDSFSMKRNTIESINVDEALRTQLNDGNVLLCRNCGRLNSPTRTTCKTCKGDLLV